MTSEDLSQVSHLFQHLFNEVHKTLEEQQKETVRLYKLILDTNIALKNDINELSKKVAGLEVLDKKIYQMEKDKRATEVFINKALIVSCLALVLLCLVLGFKINPEVLKVLRMLFGVF